jgi:parvulin-like peptidyl-prolyl isomerase
MLKRFIGSAAAALFLSASLQAHTIAPDEIKQFAEQALRIDFDNASDEVKKKITAEYTDRVKLAEILVAQLKNDPEFIRLTEAHALDVWSKRVANTINPTDEELQKVFKNAKDLNIAPSYKLRHIVVKQESLADDLMKQLEAKTGDERNRLFVSLAAANSQDVNTKEKGGAIGWVDSSALPPMIITLLKDKEAGSLVKVDLGKDVWDIILLDEVKPERPATFEESKSYLVTVLRQQGVEDEAKKLLEAHEKTSSSVKKGGKPQHK